VTIFRNPVEDAKIPHPLACIDLDPATGERVGEECWQRLRARPDGKRRPYFQCPNAGGGAGRCSTHTFLYPRWWKTKKGEVYVHDHQGIDIFATPGTPIRSVTAGTVHAASNEFIEGYGGYGLVVVIKTTDGSGRPLYFLYAHCNDVLVHEDEAVSEGQVIATVGTTCFSGPGSKARFPEREAHLHFEASNVEYPRVSKRPWGEPFSGSGRLDPYAILERLGPWSMTKVYLPWGGEVTRAKADERHAKLDASSSGGYFPLGINNSWHGGLHLPAPQGSTLVAPFDATIVAARLDPDPDHALHHEGHSNFILLRHQLSEAAHALFQGKSPDDVEPGTMPAAGAPPDPRRTLYCLLMHLQPLAITDALAKDFPWVAKLDPALRTPSRTADGMAKVLTDLSIPVRSGDPLWASGRARGFTADGSTTALFDQLHWELFSEHLLTPEWDPPLEDLTDDLTLDVPRHVIDRLEQGGPTVDEDGQLQPHEVREIYRTGRAGFLRRTPCRFVDQWALDLDAAIARLDSLAYVTAGLREQLAPFMWWNEATSVLPPSRFVWHYDPIEFLADYAQYLTELSPDPATHPTLEVHVLFDNRMPMPDVPVHLWRNGELIRLRRTARDGVARFRGVPAGDYEVRTSVSDLPTTPAPVVGGRTTVVELVTELPGPPPPRGDIRVIVRNHKGTRAPDVPVMLVSAAGQVRAHALTLPSGAHQGEVRFEHVVYGAYTVSAGDAPARPVTLDASQVTAKPTLPPPLGTLYVTVTIDDAPAPHQRVAITRDTKTVATAITDPLGTATLELPEGWYRARVGRAHESVHVRGHVETSTMLALASAEAPAPVAVAEGVLEVLVTRDGEDAPDELVFVLDIAGHVLGHQYTDRDGLAIFELPVGDVWVSACDTSAGATVSAIETTRVVVVLEE